jgi:hypothetical protein
VTVEERGQQDTEIFGCYGNTRAVEGEGREQEEYERQEEG